MHHLYDYMYTLGFEHKTLVATGSNCTDSCNPTTIRSRPNLCTHHSILFIQILMGKAYSKNTYFHLGLIIPRVSLAH
jgi:hypothetical protein